MLLAVDVARAEETWTEDRPTDAELPRFSLDRIAFEGTFTSSEDDLRDAMKSSTSGILRFRPVNLDRLQGDVHRLRSFLGRQGFWEPRVDLRLLFDHERRKTRATFIIAEGRRRYLGSIVVAGNQTFDQEEILSWTRQRTGQPFDTGVTHRDRTEIENRYANEGFYLVEVTADIQDDPDPGERIVHDLVYRIVEGPRFFVGSISISGNNFTQDEIIRRELTFRTGERLSREQLIESRSRLYGTGYFTRVDLVPQRPEASQGRVGVLVNVTERKMRFVAAGIGYGTLDQLRLSGEWGNRNVLGRGKRATVRGLLATELFPAEFSRARLEGRLVEPRLLGSHTQATGELFYERSREPFTISEREDGEYDLSLVGLSVDLNRRLSRYTQGWVSLENEWADVDERIGTPPTSARPDLTRTVGLTLQRDRRNDIFAPTKGFLHRVTGSVSGGLLGGDNDFWQTSIEGSWYRRMRGVTLAGRVQTGYERVYGESMDIPDRQRFKTGGSSSVRGYREEEIGAGDFLLLTNLELRFPLFWVVAGGLFLDGGNAWPKPTDMRWRDFELRAKDDPARSVPTDYRYSTGVGIRTATPVGPVRLDWGYKLKILPVVEGQATEDRWRIHLSLGHVF